MRIKHVYLIKNSAMFVLLMSVITTGCSTFDKNRSIAKRASLETTKSDKDFIDKWGINVLSLRRTAADYMLDFRFRILDPKKAAIVLDRDIKPYLLVESTGKKYHVPVTAKLGPLRQTARLAKADRNYYMFFANPGKVIKKGEQVTIVIGDFKAEHLIVN